MPPNRVENIVIGSGPGGAITAALLAEAGREVLILEEGGAAPQQTTRPFSIEEMATKYRCGGLTVSQGSPRTAYVEGRCVGGGSEINSGLYHRTPLDLLARWQREFEVKGIEERDLAPEFDAVEKDLSVSGYEGVPPEASLKLKEGADKLHWRTVEAPRWIRPSETAPGTTRGWKRQSMSQTYVPRALGAGARLMTGTRALRIRQESDGWKVECETHAQRSESLFAKNVFLSAGAIQTPALLRRSGIHRNIGNSLFMHPTLKIVALFPEVVNRRDMEVPMHQVKEFHPAFSFGGSVSSPPFLALSLAGHTEAIRQIPSLWPRMAVYYVAATGSGQGSVRPVPGCRDAFVRYRYSASDVKFLREGMEKLSLLLREAGAEALYPSPMSAPMTIHLFSSCPMGENRRRCAADSFGRVHGFQNLFISDASLLCTALGVNPQGTIMAIARRNTRKFLGTL